MTSKRVRRIKYCLLQLVCVLVGIVFIQSVHAETVREHTADIISMHVRENGEPYRAEGEHATADTQEQSIPSIDDIMLLLEERVNSLQDIQAVVTLQQLDEEGRRVINEAKMEVAMSVAGMFRLTFLRPELLQGNVFVLDYEEDTIYEYYPVYDLVQCLPLETYLETSPLEPMINTLNGLIVGLPNGDVVTDLKVVETTTLHGREHVLLRGEATAPVVDSELEDIIEDTAESTIGVPLSVRVDDVMYVWVDMENHVVSQIHVVTAAGNLAVAVEVENVQINSNLTADDLKRFPRGVEIRRCR